MVRHFVRWPLRARHFLQELRYSRLKRKRPPRRVRGGGDTAGLCTAELSVGCTISCRFLNRFADRTLRQARALPAARPASRETPRRKRRRKPSPTAQRARGRASLEVFPDQRLHVGRRDRALQSEKDDQHTQHPLFERRDSGDRCQRQGQPARLLPRRRHARGFFQR